MNLSLLLEITSMHVRLISAIDPFEYDWNKTAGIILSSINGLRYQYQSARISFVIIHLVSMLERSRPNIRKALITGTSTRNMGPFAFCCSLFYIWHALLYRLLHRTCFALHIINLRSRCTPSRIICSSFLSCIRICSLWTSKWFRLAKQGFAEQHACYPENIETRITPETCIPVCCQCFDNTDRPVLYRIYLE